MVQFLTAHAALLEILLFICAFAISALVYPFILKIALKFNIVDNPDARKLQREPVPVMGGYAVFCGVVFPIYLSSIFFGFSSLTLLPILFLVMLVLGGIDDVRQLSPKLRAVIEVGVVAALIFVAGMQINDFHGLLGINILPWYVSVPLSLFAGVGIINAINLIDGVDGFSSGYCIMACGAFAALYSTTPHVIMMTLAIVCVGALIPFYVHNVFGDKSKMFIGDSGTMFMGILMTVLVFRFLSNDLEYSEGPSPVPFALAILAVPVFDTIRVMFRRIFHGQSPFYPDKTHLHHAFIGVGFSHSVTSTIIVALNALLIFAVWITYKLGASEEIQLVVTVIGASLITFGLYNFLFHCKAVADSGARQSHIVRAVVKLAVLSHIERKGVWKRVRDVLDRVQE